MPCLQTTLASQQGQTVPCPIPLQAANLEIFYAGLTFDLGAGAYGSVTPTHSFRISP